MTPLYTINQFNSAKSTDFLPMQCEHCLTPFNRAKKDIKRALLGTKSEINFCSISCKMSYRSPSQLVNCTNCEKPFKKYPFEIKKSKSGNHFCSSSCAATFNNKNKSTGTRRSKLEAWLESQLITLYPSLDFHFNKKDAINSELDIYVPALRLAFELNGIFHCEPIYGQDKLDQIQANDELKFKACAENNITLCMIDTSKQKYFKESTSKQFLDIIIYHINWINLLANLPK